MSTTPRPTASGANSDVEVLDTWQDEAWRMGVPKTKLPDGHPYLRHIEAESSKFHQAGLPWPTYEDCKQEAIKKYEGKEDPMRLHQILSAIEWWESAPIHINQLTAIAYMPVGGFCTMSTVYTFRNIVRELAWIAEYEKEKGSKLAHLGVVRYQPPVAQALEWIGRFIAARQDHAKALILQANPEAKPSLRSSINAVLSGMKKDPHFIAKKAEFKIRLDATLRRSKQSLQSPEYLARDERLRDFENAFPVVASRTLAASDGSVKVTRSEYLNRKRREMAPLHDQKLNELSQKQQVLRLLAKPMSRYSQFLLSNSVFAKHEAIAAGFDTFVNTASAGDAASPDNGSSDRGC